MWNSAENVFSRSASFREEDDEEEALRWAALERLPTYARVRRGIFRNMVGDRKEVDVSELELTDQRLLLERLVKSTEDDPEQFFDRMRKRIEAVELKFPKIEVRFQNLTVESFVHVGSRALPTIPNFIFNMAEAFLRQLRMYQGRRSKLTILDDCSGIVRPSRCLEDCVYVNTLSCCSLYFIALKMSGEVTYNGHGLKEFVPPRTSAYVSQQDWHVAEMTDGVKVLDLNMVSIEKSTYIHKSQFHVAYLCLLAKDMLVELARREKNAGIKPDEDLDIFMKSLALGGNETSLVVEYIMKILGLDLCADTLVGDEMLKGISGGQKKRLTTGELLVGPARVLFMDEISNGLDSSTTYQIIKYLRHSTCALDGTTVISLLQPAPETYHLFDDVILLCEGQIVYQGPREEALDFFAFMGFKCPERKNVADFLQEVLSKKDQQQYWSLPFQPYRYITPGKFSEAFRSYQTGKNLYEELSIPFDKRYSHPAALSTSRYGVKKNELLKTNFNWQMLLMKRNSFIYVFKFIQLFIVALITMSVFMRTVLHHNTIDDGGLYLGALYFSMVIILFNGFTEVSMLVAKLPVLYKHRALHFYPTWAYTLPSWLLSIPTSLYESGFWVAISYYVIGYDPNFTRFLRQFLLYFCLHQMSIALFRVIGSLGRNMIVANTFGSFAMLVVMALGGYIISRDHIPSWWIWGYWVSPLMYAQNAASVNEFLGNSWNKRAGNYTNFSLGEALLRARSYFPESYWYWIGVGALLGYTVLLNILFTFFLANLNPLGKQQAVFSKEELQERDNRRKGENVTELRHYLQYSSSVNGEQKAFPIFSLFFFYAAKCFNLFIQLLGRKIF
ncbi:ABC transporter G family member 32-like [Gossypium australe]|uniref:ABC transporter G family member 32-like n=1 Tax=Gossypium australe TaxID=47621 RepID=A0A5B6X948_9ROSI|nr:ABC transporter G family member 32-like [Gossypium australe]